MITKETRGQHMLQLDGLRALAVAGVMWSHWMPAYQYGLEWGLMGVNLFFVLSGFLITGILLDGRAAAVGTPERWHTIRQFYVRRILRIFPLFYMTLLLLLLLGVRPARQTIFWHLTYLSNVLFFRQGAWLLKTTQLSHFWSLAVEEQFYLVWPYLIIFLPFRLLRPVVVSLIALAPVYRVVMSVADPGNRVAFVLTIGCLDALGIGALLAYAQRRDRDSPQPGRQLGWWLLWIGLPAWLMVEALNQFALAPAPLLTLRQTFLDLVFGWVIITGAAGFKGWVGWFLQCPPMAYLGKISYALYVFHNLTIYAVVFMVRDLHAPEALLTVPWLSRLMLLVLTIAAAAISWRFFEKPLNDLKRYFPYNTAPRARQVSLAQMT